MHHALSVNDLVLQTDSEGRLYYSLAKGPDKTHNGGLNYKPRLVEPKMYATDSEERCPVRIVQKYISKRPIKMINSGPLYLAIIDKPKDPSVWYKITPLGEHSLGNMMKNIVKGTNVALCPKKLSNHSSRKTVVRKLKCAGFAKSEIKNITGHSRADGLDPYDSGNEDEMCRMSNALVVPTTCPRSSSITPSCTITTPAQMSHQQLTDQSCMSNQQLFSSENQSISTNSSGYFSMGIPWKDANPTIVHGNMYVFNNCQGPVNIDQNSEQQPSKKRLRVIISSDESQ